MASQKSLALLLWEKALPLSHGRANLAPKEMRERWNAAHRTFWAEEANALLANGPDGRPSVQEFFHSMHGIFEPKAAITREVDEWIAQQLRSGAIIGLGFEPPRRIDSDPILIPKQNWRFGLGPAPEKLSVDGLNFAEIRALPRAMVERIGADWKAATFPPHPAPKRGPRGSAIDIFEAFQALHAAGRIDPHASAMSHYPAIRDWLQHHHPDAGYSATKPSDETIRKTFQPMFDQAPKPRPT